MCNSCSCMIIIVVRDANAMQIGKRKGRMMVKLLTLHVAIEKDEP